MFNMYRPRHIVTYNSIEAIGHVKELVKSNPIPIPAAFRHLDFFFEDNNYQPKENSIETLEMQIQKCLHYLESIEKAKFVVRNIVLPNFYEFGPPSPCALQITKHLEAYLLTFAVRQGEFLQYLQDDLFYKRKQLRKRQEKRKRYSDNKKKRNVRSFFGSAYA